MDGPDPEIPAPEPASRPTLLSSRRTPGSRPPLDAEALLALDELERLAAQTGPEPQRLGSRLAFRTRLMVALVATAILPLALFGLILLLTHATGSADTTLPRLLLLAIVIAALTAVLLAYLIAADLTGPLRAIAAAVDRASAGDLSTPILVAGDDELADWPRATTDWRVTWSAETVSWGGSFRRSSATRRGTARNGFAGWRRRTPSKRSG